MTVDIGSANELRNSESRKILRKKNIDAIWIDAARRAGFQIVRTDRAYATSDGNGNIEIGTDETLDDDDCLAQLIFHELCHALVQGEGNLARADFGLDNTSDDDLVREHACLRVQAALATRSGLRELMTPTTVVRDHYIGLPADPLAPAPGESADDACRLAVAAVRSELYLRWAAFLDDALEATARCLNA